jgi:hypothetical protein
VGVFKDMGKLTKQAKQLQKQQQEQAGYKPGLKGMLDQMGDLTAQATQQLGEIIDAQGDNKRILAEGRAGTAKIIGLGTPARGAQQFNLDLDLEVHAEGLEPYRVANQYIVPATAQLGPGVELPVKVDRDDPAKIAIAWEQTPQGPKRGEIRPA